MFGCTHLDLFRSKKRNNSPPNPITIDIQSVTKDNTESWRAAVLSSNPKSYINIVSRRLVTEILEASFHPLDHEDLAARKPRKHAEEDVEGYIDLVWAMENNRNVHKTRFHVSATYDPPYDAVLGKEDSVRYDMLRNAKGRPRNRTKT